MSYRLRDKLMRARYNLSCRGIFNTPPLTVRPAPLTFLSMVSHSDLTMYLVAIKSMYRAIGEGRVVIVNDGSLTEQDQAVLKHHIPGIEIRHIKTVETAPCPRGGVWERLLTAMDLASDAYVIQVDSDIVATDKVPEVAEAYRSNRSFMLGTYPDQTFVTTAEASAHVADNTSNHIQILAERSLAKLDGNGYRYSRGCAGFSGYAKGGHSRADAEAWSQRMEDIVGKRWDEWGSEQVTSNLLIANRADSLILPYPLYANFHPAQDLSGSRLLHFMGTYRFDAGGYIGASRRIIRELNGG